MTPLGLANEGALLPSASLQSLSENHSHTRVASVAFAPEGPYVLACVPWPGDSTVRHRTSPSPQGTPLTGVSTAGPYAKWRRRSCCHPRDEHLAGWRRSSSVPAFYIGQPVDNSNYLWITS